MMHHQNHTNSQFDKQYQIRINGLYKDLPLNEQLQGQ